MPKFTTQDYGQMLRNGGDNFTATYFSDVIGHVSHDSITRSIADIKLSPKVLREKALELSIPTNNGYLALDDTVLDKGLSEAIEVASAQYSGQKHGITTGIGVVTLVYINPELEQFWILDYRIYDKRTDGLKKTDQALEMIQYWQTIHELHPGRAPFTTVLIDAGYTCKKIMQYIVRKDKLFYGVMPKSRKVSYLDQDGLVTTKHVGDFNWAGKDARGEKLRTNSVTVCIEDLPNDKPLRLFLVTAKHRVEYIVTNDVSIETTKVAKKVGGFRWKIEQFHREVKQLTGVAKPEKDANSATTFVLPLLFGTSLMSWCQTDEELALRSKKYSLTGIPETTLEKSSLPAGCDDVGGVCVSRVKPPLQLRIAVNLNND